MSTITLYGTPLSGHVHRVALLLRTLALPYEWVEASADVRQSAAFRRLNPFGQIPVLQDGDLTLADSNAILVYLAKRYAPDSHYRRPPPETARPARGARCRRRFPKPPAKSATARRPAD